jgi:hypothetical protein
LFNIFGAALSGGDIVPTFRQTIAISADGKAMTVTIVGLAPNAGREPSVTVFEKQ